MGEDSVRPFLDFENKWAIVLALTSNKGGLDFQNITDKHGKQLFKQVLETSQSWGTTENMMYVVGATRAEQLSEVRAIIPHHFLLVPGVGAQGGNLKDVAKYGINSDCGLLVNSSRGIIYAGNGSDFAEKARGEAQRQLQDAEAYKQKVIAVAEGEADRFSALLVEYKKAPEVTRQRLYLDAVEEVLSSSTKVMIDVEGGNNLLYLPLDQLIKKQEEDDD